MEKELIYNGRKLNTGNVWLMFMFLGWSYGSMDKIGKQILFYFTIGGFGLWTLYVMFTLNKKIKEHNKKIALQCGFEVTDLLKHGLV
jgi:hypothetical protein